MESARIRARHSSGSGVSSILQPVNGVRDAMRRKGKAPRDHARDNIRAMRAQQRNNRMAREEAAAADRDAGFKMRRFKNVKSRVDRSGAAKDEASGSSPPQPRKKFLRKGSKLGADCLPAPKPFRRPGQRKARVPRATEQALIAPRSQTNFLDANAREIIHAAPVRREEAKEETKHKEFGHVPAYLQRRKMREAAQEADRIAHAPDPDCPPGMTLMPEGERQETLRVLRATLDDVKGQMQRLPLTIETPSQIRRKNALEAKFKEVEDAVKIFSRPKVFVRDD